MPDTTDVDLVEPPEPLLRWFAYAHLNENLQRASKPFGVLAAGICEILPRSAERTVALRKLLESKDAAVRAYVEFTTTPRTDS